MTRKSKKNTLKKAKHTRKKDARRAAGKDLAGWQKDLLFGVVLLVLLLALRAPEVFQGQIYADDDNREVIVANHQMLQFQEATGEIAYWNPYPWGGVPNLFFVPRSMLSFDYYLDLLTEWTSLSFLFFLWGGLGMYFLGKHLFTDRLMAGLGALLFVMAPYFESLLIAGHHDKIEAMMHLPWVVWGFLMLMERVELRSLLLFCLAFALQLRASHYQIVFYTGFLLLFLYLALAVPLVREKQYQILGKKSLALVFGAMFALALAAQPFFIAAKHSGISVRGQHVIGLDDEDIDQQPASGVNKDFVALWSMKPGELLSLVIPRARGGLSLEQVEDAENLGYRDGIISGYWGHSPFNGTYYYVGAIVFLLMVVGSILQPREPVFWALLTTSLLMIIWAIGTFAGWFYDFCYSVVPFFKNLRTAPTSLSLLYLTAPLMALYGLESLKSMRAKELRQNKTMVALGLIIGLGALLFLMADSFSYLKTGEDSAQVAQTGLRELRKQLLVGDVFRYLILVILAMVILWLQVKRKISLIHTLLAIAVLTAIDFYWVQQRHTRGTTSERIFRQTHLAGGGTAQFFKGDEGLFRVLPLAQGNLGLPYHVQTVGGGFELQMSKLAFEVYSNCLHHRVDGTLPVNWNVLDMLNVKYVVTEGEVNHGFLSLEYTDEARGLYTYRYKFSRPRGYFVDRFEVIKDPYERLQRLNDKSLDLRSVALLERQPAKPVQQASRSTTEVLSFSPNQLTINVDAVADGLFVLAEIYVPDLQQIYLDGALVTDVYKTNHLIQSIWVPKGLHTIEIRYGSRVYTVSQTVSNIAWGIFWILALLLGGSWLRQRRAKA